MFAEPPISGRTTKHSDIASQQCYVVFYESMIQQYYQVRTTLARLQMTTRTRRRSLPFFLVSDSLLPDGGPHGAQPSSRLVPSLEIPMRCGMVVPYYKILRVRTCCESSRWLLHRQTKGHEDKPLTRVTKSHLFVSGDYPDKPLYHRALN